MKRFLIVLSLGLLAQSIFLQCLYIDPRILIVNCGESDRYEISRAVETISRYNPRVIGINFILFDERPGDSVLIKRLANGGPIVLPITPSNYDSAYFNLSNCQNGPLSINGNKVKEAKFLHPFLRINGRLRDSFEFLVLKQYDISKYLSIKRYLSKYDLKKITAKAKIEFNGSTLSCFNSIAISEVDSVEGTYFKNKIVLLGYFGDGNPDVPADKDKDRFANRVYASRKGGAQYMYNTLIAANVISNFIRKEIRPEKVKSKGD